MIKNKGGGLLEVVLGVSLASAVAVFLMNIYKNQGNLQTKLSQKYNQSKISGEIAALLGDAKSCEFSLKDTPLTNTDITLSYVNESNESFDRFQAGEIPNSQGLSISEIRLNNVNSLTANQTGPLDVEIDISKKSVGGTDVITTKKFLIIAKLDSSSRIESCHSPLSWAHGNTVNESFRKLCIDIGGTYDPLTHDCSAPRTVSRSEVCSLVGKTISSDGTACEGGGCPGCCAKQRVKWSSCYEDIPALENGSNRSLSNRNGNYNGSASISCSNGSITINSQSCTRALFRCPRISSRCGSTCNGQLQRGRTCRVKRVSYKNVCGNRNDRVYTCR